MAVNASKPIPFLYNQDLFGHYRTLIAIRNASRALQRGDFTALLTEDYRKLYGFQRKYEGETAVVIINCSARAQTVALNLTDVAWRDVLNDEQTYLVENGRLTTEIPPQWARIFVSGDEAVSGM